MSTSLGKRLELEMRARPADQILDLNLDNCRANKIEGSEGLTSDFTNLQTLSLINLGLQSLENFPKLGNLRKLELSDNKIATGLSHLAGCPNITHLSLSGNKIKDFDVLSPLKDLSHLKSLDLFNCEVTNHAEYREKVFGILSQLVFLDGFDKDEKEQEDVDGEEDDEDDDDDDDQVDDEDDDDDDSGDEVGLSYLTKNIDDDDEEDEEDFDPDGVVVEEDTSKVIDADDDDDDDEEEEDGAADDDDDEEDEDDDEDDEEDADDSANRGTKRKHEDEVEQEEDDA